MCRVKATIKKSVFASERVAYIKTAAGMAEVIVARRQVGRDFVQAAEIAREGNLILVELPRETTAGNWRVWVKPNQLRKD